MAVTVAEQEILDAWHAVKTARQNLRQAHANLNAAQVAVADAEAALLEAKRVLDNLT